MAGENINNIFTANDDLTLDLDIKTEIHFLRKDHPAGKMIPIFVEGKEEYILIPLDVKDGDTIKISGRGKYNSRLGKTGDLYVLVHIEEKKIPWAKICIPVLIVALLAAICGLFVFILQKDDSDRYRETNPTVESTLENSGTYSAADIAYANAETHCGALAEKGDYEGVIQYLIECQAQRKDDNRYTLLLAEYQEMQKNAILNEAAEYVTGNKYRMAIHTKT